MDFKTGGQQVIFRLVEAYGFSTRQMLCDHLGVSKSTLATRFMRDIFPAEWVVQCAIETGVSLKWLTTGQGNMFEGINADLVEVPKKKILDGKIQDASYVCIDKALFTRTFESPVVVIENGNTYIAEYKYTTTDDGVWIIGIDNSISIRKVIRLPGERVKVGTNEDNFECSISDIEFIGKVIFHIEEL